MITWQVVAEDLGVQLDHPTTFLIYKGRGRAVGEAWRINTPRNT